MMTKALSSHRIRGDQGCSRINCNRDYLEICWYLVIPVAAHDQVPRLTLKYHDLAETSNSVISTNAGGSDWPGAAVPCGTVKHGVYPGEDDKGHEITAAVFLKR